MSEPVDRVAVRQMMRGLDGFARSLGLDEGATRTIVEKVIADMPEHLHDERMMEARKRMLLASA
jgi:hypothetical protein